MTQPSTSPATHPTGGVPRTRQLPRSKSHRRSTYTPPAGALRQLVFDSEAQCFQAPGGEKTTELAEQTDRPLSLTFQLTRDCNFSCTYCSEPPGISTRSLQEVLAMLDKLSGMRRIILSGGEPMRYKHFWEVLEYCQDRFEQVVLSTNASMITRDGAAKLRTLVDYVDVTVDGPRRQHDRIRGNYDMVLRGLRRVAEEDIPLSVICVYLGRNKRQIHYICQTGDVFGAKKVKILTTIPKGYSRNLFEDFTTGEELDELERFLTAEREACGWQPRITIADWMKIGAGHAILIEPDGRAVACPGMMAAGSGGGAVAGSEGGVVAGAGAQGQKTGSGPGAGSRSASSTSGCGASCTRWSNGYTRGWSWCTVVRFGVGGVCWGFDVSSASCGGAVARGWPLWERMVTPAATRWTRTVLVAMR